jgi:hypothetical protein
MQPTLNISRTKAALLMGVSTELLASWEKEPEKAAESLCGHSSKFSDEQIKFIVTFWKAYSAPRQKVKFGAFMKQLRKAWKKTAWVVACPSRKTVEDMLLANGVRQPQAQQPKTPPTDRVKQFFPNAQVLLDGKEVEVIYKGQAYYVTIEFCKDVAAGATTGMAVGESERYALVKKALAEHQTKYGDPLATLTDNGPANRPLEIALGRNEKLVIRGWPYRPQTRGHIENEFSIFEKKVSRIVITGETDQEIVMSIVDVVARMYLRLRNQIPRCGVCPMTPEKLMQFNPSALESENAYRVLATERDKRREQQEHALKISAEKADLIDSIVKEHQLQGDRLLLKQSLRHVELAAIKEAERRFAVVSQRDTFDPSKRKMAYFCRIALNVQQERDQARRQEVARKRYGLEQKARREREKRELELAYRAEEQQLKKQPYEVIFEGFENYRVLPNDFREHTSFWRPLVDDAIVAIKTHRHARRRQELIDRARQRILAQSQASLSLRYEFIAKVDARMIELGLNMANSVTPK